MKYKAIILLLLCKPALSAMFIDNQKQDYYTFSDAQTTQASAVGAVVSTSNSSLVKISENEWEMKIVKLTDKKGVKKPLNLCEGELFSEYMRGDTARSWGVLISPEHFLLSGHSMDAKSDCDKKKVVFGFNGENVDQNTTKLNLRNENVYSCQEIKFLRYDGNPDTRPENYNVLSDAGLIDIAVIKLDRPVNHIEPVKIEFNLNPLEIDQELFLIAGFMGTPFFGEDSLIKSQTRDYSLIGLNSSSSVGTSGGPYFDKNGFLRAIHVASSTGDNWSTTTIDEAGICKKWIETSNSEADFLEPIFSKKRNIWMPSYSSAINVEILEGYISEYLNY